MVTARVVGALFSYIGQPAVIGEVVGGILLGPSLLGRIAPDLHTPCSCRRAIAPFLTVYAQFGVILYMFLVGLELDLSIIRKHGHVTLAISHASIIVPFLLGVTLALGLYPVLSTTDVPFTVFALFLGVSLSVTAFPVLARILTDRKISRSRMGARRAHVRRGGRCDGLVPAGAGGGHCARAGGGCHPCRVPDDPVRGRGAGSRGAAGPEAAPASRSRGRSDAHAS